MFKYRIISFIVLLGVLALIFFGPEPYNTALFRGLAGVVVGLMIFELGQMLERLDMTSYKLPAALFGGVFTICMLYQFWWSPLIFAVAFALPVLFCGGALLVSDNFALTLKKVVITVGIFMISIVTAGGAAMIGNANLSLFAFFVLGTKSGDTGAYCVGMLSNKITKGRNHPIAPRISPKKSVEGTIGGIIFAIAVTMVLGYYGRLVSFSPAVLAILGFAFFWGGFLGDLTESVMKRGCGIKDSGALLPGMGGIWDVMDSFIYNGPLFCLIFHLFQLN